MSSSLAIDPLGFPKIWDATAELQARETYIRRQREQEERWAKWVEKRDKSQPINRRDKGLKKLIRGGIPHSMRPFMWAQLSGVLPNMERNPELYSQLTEMESVTAESVIRVIDNDIARTYQKATAFDPQALRRILIAFANFRIDIGYCQSMSYIAAILLAVVGEMPAFWILDHIVSSFPERYYTRDMRDYQLDLKVIEQLLEERVPKVCRHAEKIGYEFVMSISGWLLSMFTMDLPVPTVLRIFDVFFFEGPKILFRVSIALMRKFETHLLTAVDVQDFTKMLQVLMKNVIDADGLLTEAFGIRGFSRGHIDDVRKEIGQTGDEQKLRMSTSLQHFWGRLGL